MNAIIHSFVKRSSTALLVAALWLCLGPRVARASSTNNFFGAVTTNQITLTSSANNTDMDIWNPGSSFSITTNLVVYASGGNATFLMNGSTGTINDVGTTLPIDMETGGTGTVSLVNSVLTITNNGSSLIWINSYHVGVLDLTNSTLQVTGDGGGLWIDYNGGQQARLTGSTNVLTMKSSTIDMGAQTFTVGFDGYAAIANIEDSVVTNAATIWIGADNNAAVSMNVRNSSITMATPTNTIAIYFDLGSLYGASVTMDHSTLTTANYGTLFLIGNGSTSTGLLNLVNGSTISFLGATTGGRPFDIGASGHGTLNISNSTVTLAVPAALINHQLDMEVGVDASGNGTMNVSSGTNLIERSLIVGESGTGLVAIDGNSLVQVSVPFAQPSPQPGSVILGQHAGSTGTVTLAGSSLLLVTNSTHVSSVVVGAAGRGTFIQNGGTLIADNLFVTNGANSIFTFNAGTIQTRHTVIANGQAFVVGDGTHTATLDLVSGTHQFANGLTIASNGVLNGFASIQGDVTVQDGGILAPGNSPGTLTFSNNLTLSGNSILNFELGPHTAAGVGYVGGGTNDLAIVVGTLTLDGILDVTPLANFGGFGSGASGTNVYRLFNYSGTLVNDGLTIGSLPSYARAWVDLGTPGQVNLIVVPEPSAALLLAGGILLALLRRK